MHTIDGLEIRYATGGRGGKKVVLFSPWPDSIFAFAPVWAGLTKEFEVLAIDLPGFGPSEARDDPFASQKMGEFIANMIQDFGSNRSTTSERRRPSLPRSRVRISFRSLILGAGASTYTLVVDGVLQSLIEAQPLPPLNAAEVMGRFVGAIREYAVPKLVADDYLAP
jgi:hypothetical protein